MSIYGIEIVFSLYILLAFWYLYIILFYFRNIHCEFFSWLLVKAITVNGSRFLDTVCSIFYI